jgi:hypothetical protein
MQGLPASAFVDRGSLALHELGAQRPLRTSLRGQGGQPRHLLSGARSDPKMTWSYQKGSLGKMGERKVAPEAEQGECVHRQPKSRQYVLSSSPQVTRLRSPFFHMTMKLPESDVRI